MMRLPIFILAVLWGPVAVAASPRVATDIAPVHSLVAQVMEGVGSPDLIVRQDASPHGYALRPSEAASLADAELVVWMGAGLTPWLTGAIDTLAGDARQITLLEVEGTLLLPLRDGVEFGAEFSAEGHDDHDEHEAHEDHEEQGHESHGHEGHHHEGGVDPHAWLDPANAQIWLRVIAAELSLLDPENADLYRANAERAVAELAVLIDDVYHDLDPVRGLPYLVSHDAYQYFEVRFDLPATAAVSLGDAARPGAARLAKLRKLAQDREIACVLREPQVDTKSVGVILGEDVKTGVLNPIGVGFDLGPRLYPAMIRALAAEFSVCVG